MFLPPPTVADVCGLWRRGLPRHFRRWALALMGLGLHASTFLRPLAPRALPRFIATMDALPPAGRLFGPLGHEHRSVPAGLPAYLDHASNPSVSNHPAAPARAFVFVHALFLLRTAGQRTLPAVASRGNLSHQGLGRGFAQR